LATQHSSFLSQALKLLLLVLLLGRGRCQQLPKRQLLLLVVLLLVELLTRALLMAALFSWQGLRSLQTTTSMSPQQQQQRQPMLDLNSSSSRCSLRKGTLKA
jgi:hypothetical protein